MVMFPRIFFFAAACAVLSSAQTITLSSEEEVYLGDDVRAFHEAIIAPSGERVVLTAVIDGQTGLSPVARYSPNLCVYLMVPSEIMS